MSLIQQSEGEAKCSIHNDDCDKNFSITDFMKLDLSSESEINSVTDIDGTNESSSICVVKHLSSLYKQLESQKEQIQHFHRMFITEDDLIALKDTCKSSDDFTDNDNVILALDKFKYENNMPSKFSLVKQEIMKALVELRGVILYHENFIASMSSDPTNKINVATSELCHNSANEGSLEQKLFFGMTQLVKVLNSLKNQMKRLSLIEDEKINLIEKVYSSPINTRQYCSRIIVLEHERKFLEAEIDNMRKKYEDLQLKCKESQATYNELNKYLENKMSEIDLDKIKPGLEKQIKTMELIEKGELFLMTMTKDEKEMLTNEIAKLRSENADLLEKLENYDKIFQDREDLCRQNKALANSCLHLETELNNLKIDSKTADDTNKFKEVNTERDNLKADSYKMEIEKLKVTISELEEIKVLYFAFLDRNACNPNMITPTDRTMYRRMLEHLKQMHIELSKCKGAVVKQEQEIKNLLYIIDHLIEKIQTLYKSGSTIEIPKYMDILSPKQMKRLEMVKKRVRYPINSQLPDTGLKIKRNGRNTDTKDVILNSIKNLLGIKEDPDDSVNKCATT